MNFILSEKYRTLAILLLLTAGALLVHGYHPYAEDAEIYLPGVEKILHPGLFPTGQEFFASHASLTIFPNLIAFSLRVTHLPFETGLFLWHVASIFLLLLACWELSSLLFPSATARWGGVCLVAALLDDSGGGNCALHHGSVFEPAESGGVRRRLCRRPNS